jgi:hypothetical protein
MNPFIPMGKPGRIRKRRRATSVHRTGTLPRRADEEFAAVLAAQERKRRRDRALFERVGRRLEERLEARRARDTAA